MKKQFANAALSYTATAVVAGESGRRMAERLNYCSIDPQRMADIGCACGDGIRELQRRYPKALPLAIDFALPMLGEVKAMTPLLQRLRGKSPRLVNADVRALPIANHSLDLVWSNLMLHWLDEPIPALREIQRVLSVGGLLMFTMFGPDTLKELRAACVAVGVEPPLRHFIDMHDIGDMLIACDYADPVMDREVITLTYDHPAKLLRDQRHLGVRDALLGHLGWRAWRSVIRAYVRNTPRLDERLPASFEIIYGHAWKPQTKAVEDGRAIIRFGISSLSGMT